MDASNDHAEAPELHLQHAHPALPDIERPQALQPHVHSASASEQTAAQPSHMPSDEAPAVFRTSADAQLPSTALHEVAHHQPAMQQPHSKADVPAPEQQPAAAVESAAQAPEVASYEELATFTSPVGAEMPATGQLKAAQDHQPTREPHAVPVGTSVHEHAAAPDQNAVTAVYGGDSHDGHKQQEAQHQGQVSASEEGLNAPATHAPAELPFHPEQSLQEVQQAADGQLVHDADERTGRAQRAAAEAPDVIMGEAAHVSERENVRVDQAGARLAPGHGTPQQQNGRTPSAPAVRTLDDIMAQFEGPALPRPDAQLPAAAPAVPAQQHTENSLAPHAEPSHPVHDAQDVHMADADQPELAQKGSVEATPEGATLQGKVRCTPAPLVCQTDTVAGAGVRTVDTSAMQQVHVACQYKLNADTSDSERGLRFGATISQCMCRAAPRQAQELPEGRRSSPRQMLGASSGPRQRATPGGPLRWVTEQLVLASRAWMLMLLGHALSSLSCSSFALLKYRGTDSRMRPSHRRPVAVSAFCAWPEPPGSQALP